MRIVLPSGPNLLALASRLTKTCVSRGASPTTSGRNFGQRHLERLAALRQQALDELASVAHDVLERDALRRIAELARLDAHALEQVVDQPRQPQRAALQRASPVPASCSRGISLQVVLQQLDRRELRGERRAELVRDIGEDGVARAPGGLEIGLVAHDLHLQAVDHAGRW